jgi:hypothetical protein
MQFFTVNVGTIKMTFSCLRRSGADTNMQPRAARLISSVYLRHSPDTIQALFQGRRVKNLYPIKIADNDHNHLTINLETRHVSKFQNYTGRFMYQGTQTVKFKGCHISSSTGDIFDWQADGYANYCILLSEVVPYECGMILPKGLQEGDILVLKTTARLKKTPCSYHGHMWG